MTTESQDCRGGGCCGLYLQGLIISDHQIFYIYTHVHYDSRSFSAS